MEWIIGSNIATFILAWIISRTVTKHDMLERQAELEAKRQNARIWMDFINSQGGSDE